MNFREYQRRERLLQFIQSRMEGASKIAQKSKEKIGPSLLTYWHFNSKVRAYKDLIQKIEEGKDLDLTKRFDALKEKVNIKMKQRVFQEMMGELEVVGEVANFD
jgi:hypothetical protein